MLPDLNPGTRFPDVRPFIRHLFDAAIAAACLTLLGLALWSPL